MKREISYKDIEKAAEQVRKAADTWDAMEKAADTWEGLGDDPDTGDDQGEELTTD